jgi:hypothetical protein
MVRYSVRLSYRGLSLEAGILETWAPNPTTMSKGDKKSVAGKGEIQGIGRWDWFILCLRTQPFHNMALVQERLEFGGQQRKFPIRPNHTCQKLSTKILQQVNR